MLFGRYQFDCRLTSAALLPVYKGSVLRGVFGLALKKVVCALKHQDCLTCLLKQRCVYALTFETTEVVPPPAGLRVTAVPHPYVIEPPSDPQTDYAPGALLSFTLLLFGEINRSLPYFIYAFEQIGQQGIGRRINGRRGRFTLEAVYCNGRTIYRGREGRLDAGNCTVPLTLAPAPVSSETIARLHLSLETPLRLKFDNRLQADLPFHVLVRATLRRASSLLACHGAGEPVLDYPGLVQEAQGVATVHTDLTWFDWQRYSSRQDRQMLMGGMLGSVVYENVPAAYLPLVDFCQAVHLGKQTAFGLGKVRSQVEA